VDKVVASAADAVADIPDGATLLIGGFGVIQSWPATLMEALVAHGSRGLTVVSNTPGVGPTSPQQLAAHGLMRKLIASYAVYPTQRAPVGDGILAGTIELELVPQGTFAERIRAGGAGIGGFFTPTAYGTLAAEGKETRVIDGRHYVLEPPLTADFAFVKAWRGDRGSAISCTGARHATSIPSWPPPRASPSPRSRSWSSRARSIRITWSRRASSSATSCRASTTRSASRSAP
jgi:3-oxoadipate CoA-transferase alpha subunit